MPAPTTHVGFAHSWGWATWVSEDDIDDPLEIYGEETEILDPATDGDVPFGVDPLDILIAMEDAQEAA